MDEIYKTYVPKNEITVIPPGWNEEGTDHLYDRFTFHLYDSFNFLNSPREDVYFLEEIEKS